MNTHDDQQPATPRCEHTDDMFAPTALDLFDQTHSDAVLERGGRMDGDALRAHRLDRRRVAGSIQAGV